jgi:hypothetical protein
VILYEALLFVALFAMAAIWPAAILRVGAQVERLAAPLLRRPRLMPLATGALAAAGTALVLFAGPELSPAVHDEFAYLLGAETFAAGRLTNPTPPAWESFETFHEIMRPSYQSKYPPGQSLWLALGLRVANLEVALIALAFLMGMTTTWALGGFLAPPESLVGGLLGALRFGAGTYWTESLWGGALPAIGGALVLGAFGRLRRTDPKRPQPGRWGLLLGIGWSILVLSRPYEGLAFSLLFALVLALQAVKQRPRMRRDLSVAMLALALALAFLGRYHTAVTGSMWRLPYAEHEAQYTLTPPFLFQQSDEKNQELQYRHEVFDEYYRGWLAREHQVQREGEHLGATWARKLRTHFDFYFGLFGAFLAIVGLFSQWRRFAWPLLATSLLLIASLATAYALPHYLAPGLGVLLLLFASGMKELKRRGLRLGALAWALGLAFVLIFGARLQQGLKEQPRWTDERNGILRDLQMQPERDLVFVSYAPGHSMHREWVFNPADFATAPVLFARSRGAQEDARVRALYPERRAWTLRVNARDEAQLEELSR